MTAGVSNTTNDLLHQLDDIAGLHAVSPWPLALGWWIVLATAAALLIVAAYVFAKRRALRMSWRSEALESLQHLERGLDQGSTQPVVAALSTILRRIAVQRFPRAECAGLEGDQWLAWLQTHDPKGFEWSRRGGLLLTAPYAPPDSALPNEDVKQLLRATKAWVR